MVGSPAGSLWSPPASGMASGTATRSEHRAHPGAIPPRPARGQAGRVPFCIPPAEKSPRKKELRPTSTGGPLAGRRRAASENDTFITALPASWHGKIEKEQMSGINKRFSPIKDAPELRPVRSGLAGPCLICLGSAQLSTNLSSCLTWAGVPTHLSHRPTGHHLDPRPATRHRDPRPA